MGWICSLFVGILHVCLALGDVTQEVTLDAENSEIPTEAMMQLSPSAQAPIWYNAREASGVQAPWNLPNHSKSLHKQVMRTTNSLRQKQKHSTLYLVAVQGNPSESSKGNSCLLQVDALMIFTWFQRQLSQRFRRRRIWPDQKPLLILLANLTVTTLRQKPFPRPALQASYCSFGASHFEWYRSPRQHKGKRWKTLKTAQISSHRVSQDHSISNRQHVPFSLVVFAQLLQLIIWLNCVPFFEDIELDVRVEWLHQPRIYSDARCLSKKVQGSVEPMEDFKFGSPLRKSMQSNLLTLLVKQFFLPTKAMLWRLNWAPCWSPACWRPKFADPGVKQLTTRRGQGILATLNPPKSKAFETGLTLPGSMSLTCIHDGH